VLPIRPVTAWHQAVGQAPAQEAPCKQCSHQPSSLYGSQGQSGLGMYFSSNASSRPNAHSRSLEAVQTLKYPVRCLLNEGLKHFFFLNFVVLNHFLNIFPIGPFGRNVRRQLASSSAFFRNSFLVLWYPQNRKELKSLSDSHLVLWYPPNRQELKASLTLIWYSGTHQIDKS
jgi:hypothetical protein